MSHDKRYTGYYNPNEDDTRQYSNYCACDACIAEHEDGEMKRQETTDKLPQWATYQYRGETRDAQSTLDEVAAKAAETQNRQYWQEMMAALRVGDYFTTDEPWANDDKVTRIS
jgi:hypothetical protein